MKLQRLTILGVAACGLLVIGTLEAPAQKSKKSSSSSTVAKPQFQNKFTTVDEFIKKKLSTKTAVSIEGYVVVGYKQSNGDVLLAVVDSVDHVLSADDANKIARIGARCTVPSSAQKSHKNWLITAKKLRDTLQYTGPSVAKTVLHDTVPKVRITGFKGSAKGIISPVTSIEVTDENGDYKAI
jgi:hypothetical protein